jgi:HAD superfamily hydrolase (TIGR01490 family)
MAPARPKLALFDICRTLVSVTTVDDFTERFLLSPEHNARYSSWRRFEHYAYKRGRAFRLMRSATYRRHFVGLLRGYSEEEIAAIRKGYIRARLPSVVKAEVTAALEGLRRDGYRPILVSAGIDAHIRGVEAFFGAQLVCTTAELDASRAYTGRVTGVECVGEGKIVKLRDALPFYDDVDWNESVAFGDSMSDIPMLSLVGRPCAVDPGDGLAAYARAKGWDVLHTGPISR